MPTDWFQQEWSGLVHNVASRVVKNLFKMQSLAPSPVILMSGLGLGIGHLNSLTRPHAAG